MWGSCDAGETRNTEGSEGSMESCGAGVLKSAQRLREAGRQDMTDRKMRSRR